MNTKTLPTNLEAKTALDSAISAFLDSAPINEQDIQTAFSGIANGIQIRDYALGLVGLKINDDSDRFRFLNLFNVAGKSAHFEAIRGTYLYEAGLKEEAVNTLNLAHEMDPNNSLTTLLKRVIGSGWPVGAFASMRNELHPKVEAGIKEIEGDTVGA
jgi:NAD-dependent oxidoreductase involved in siderophore biosynthesis